MDRPSKPASGKPVPWIQWQTPMVRVLWACAPMVAASVYLFGWRTLALHALCAAVAYGVERSFTRHWREPVSSAVFVTSVLFVFSLPPMLPFWMAALGVAFGVLFGKMVFGGFGRNVFNPAMTGRAFVYISFGKQMTGEWCAPYWGFPGGLARWGRSLADAGTVVLDGMDAIATATPGSLMKQGVDHGLWDLFIGRCSGVIGGTVAPLVLAGGIYLLWKKTANHRIVYSGFAAFFVLQTIAWQLGWRNAVDPLRAAFSGSLLIGIFFYATDPVSAPSTNETRWMYGAFIGAMSVLVATFSAWPAGTMFAILLANMFAPIVDTAVRALKPARRAAPAGAVASKGDAAG